MDREQLHEVAQDIFGRYPNENTVHVTSDGQAFTDLSYARTHALKNRTGEELEVVTFKRGPIEPPKNEAPVESAKSLIERLKSATIEEMADIYGSEMAMGDNARKTVLVACEKRRNELFNTEES